MTARRWLAVALAGVALVLVAARLGAALFVDHAWYAALGAEALWRAKLVHTLLLRGLTGAVGSAFVFVNVYYVRHSIVSLVLPRRVGDLEIGEEVPGGYLMGGVVALSLALGTLLTVPYGDWTLLAQAWRGRAYGEADPFHGVDLGFYVHWLPLEEALYHWALLTLLVVSLVVIALYGLTPSLRWERGAVRMTNYVRRHLVALGVVALALLAWSFRLDQYRLLVDGSGPDGLFTYADHRIRLPANTFLVVLTASMAIVVLAAGWTGHLRRAFLGVSVVMLLSITLRQVLPPVVVRLRAPAGATRLDAAYVATRDIYTRRAFALDALVPPDSAAPLPGRAHLGDAASTWDAGALALAAGRGAEGGPPAWDLAWSARDGVLRAVDVRPLAMEEDAPGAWQATPVSTEAPAASPRASDADGGRGAMAVARPLLAPGAVGYYIVEDPAGLVPAATLRSLGSRLAHAWGEQNLRYMDADLARAGVRVLLRRDVRARVRALYPFFEQGARMSPVLADERLYWVVHLYSASRGYPLSVPLRVGGREWRSWRHAAVAVVDAATGRMVVVPVADRDALADSWIRRFPTLFSAPDAIPMTVGAQLPPAIDGASVQAAALARAGLRGAAAAGERRLAPMTGDTALAAAPTPFATADGRLAYALPVLGPGDRLAGLVLAIGGAHPRTTWRPSRVEAPRWDDVRERLTRATDTAAAARGGRPGVGALRAVPVADGGLALLLARYRTRAEGAPELVRVALATADTVTAGASVREALAGASLPPRDSAGGVAPLRPADDLERRAAALYDRMRAAMQRGDWRTYGESWDELGRLLGRSPR